MKSKLRLSFFICILALICTFMSSCKDKDELQFNLIPMNESSSAMNAMAIINPDAEVRGVWIASVMNINYPSTTDLSAEQLRNELDSIIRTSKDAGLNTIFFQARPSCDALYNSDIFPVSRYLSTNGTLTFDPLDYLVTEGHKNNIHVYAWVNPLRVTAHPNDNNSLSPSSPAVLHPDWVVEYADGKLYFNAGVPEVQQLVSDSVEEIVKKYDVDGVVFDDYFYPYPTYDDNGIMQEFDDDQEYLLYGGLFDSKADWRRNNINTIIRFCYDTVHATDPECVFGVSPAGVWQNNNGKNGGSDTRGFEAYNSLYCDALAWLEGGYIDFLSPQIYWDFNASATPYSTVLRWWNSAMDGAVTLEGKPVHLYVSHAAYKYDGSWNNPNGEMTQQVEYARSEKYYRGSMFYGYAAMYSNINNCMNDIKSAYPDDIVYYDIASNGQGVTITNPTDGSVMSDSQTYIMGNSDPYYTLTMNGEKIGRTKSGYFSEIVNLEWGENVFTFVQNGIEYKYTLYYGEKPKNADENATAEISEPVDERLKLDTLEITEIYPSSEVITKEGALWVQCIAPYESTVTAKIGDYTCDLVRLNEYDSFECDDGIVASRFGKTIEFEDFDTESDKVLSLGNVTFRCEYKGEATESLGCAVTLLGEKGKIAVRATHDYTGLKFEENSSVYNDYTDQSKGMTDYIQGLRNGFYHLKMGGYVNADDVEVITDTNDYPSDEITISAVTVSVSDDKSETQIHIMTKDKPAYYGNVSDGRFVLTLYNIQTASAPQPIITSNPLFKDCEVIRLEDKNRVRYSFSLVDTENFYGFDLHYENGVTIVTLKNPKSIDLNHDKPLENIKIVLDAGHGGWDNGAAGFVTGFSEKNFNLMVTLEAYNMLRDLGADVYLTRDEDIYLSLDERMDMMKEINPDLSISIHQNSMGYTAQITSIRGTLALYCMDSGVMLADAMGNAISSNLSRLYRGADYQMLAMCRNPKFPQCLVEVGFMTSAEEFELMADGDGVHRAAEGVKNGVIDYFVRQGKYAAYGK